MTWLIAFIAIMGVWLNIKKRWQCFVLWLISNGWWMLHNMRIGEYAQAVVFFVMFMFSIYGAYKWQRCRKN